MTATHSPAAAAAPSGRVVTQEVSIAAAPERVLRALRAHHRAIQTSDGRPAAVQCVHRKRKLRGGDLVDINAKPRQVVRPELAVANLRCAGEDLTAVRAEDVLFLNAEVVAGQVKVQVGGMADR